MDAVVKYLARDNAVALVVFGRYLTGSIFAVLVWWLQSRPALTRAMILPHLARGALIAVTAFLFYWSLTRLTLAETITLGFTTPLMIPPLAALFLGERMRGGVVASTVPSFAGVLVTVQGAPSFSGDRALALAAVLGASVTYALAAIIMRARAASDGSTIVTMTAAVVPALLLAPVAAAFAPPPLWQLGWFVALGLLGNIGIQLLARAYARAEAQAMGVLEFTALPWAALFGWFVFGEAVRPQVWLGAAIIIAACLWASRSTSIDPGPIAA